jgi:hypothetical protein
VQNLWIETDSSLVVLAFKSSSFIPWSIKTRWLNCQKIASGMNLMVTHVFREGNDIADTLATMGLNVPNLMYFTEPPFCILNSLTKNKLGLPSFRFVH